MFKISNFRLAKDIILASCRALDVPFVDLEVNVEEGEFGTLKNGIIYTGKTQKLVNTCYNIVYAYLNNFKEICGKDLFINEDQKQKTFLSIFNYFRALSYLTDSVIEVLPKEPICVSVYQFPLIWVIMKDIICPINDISLNNFKILISTSYLADVSEVIEKNDEKFIFLNADIVYDPCRLSCLLKSTIEAHGLNPKKVIGEILDSEMKDKLEGVLKIFLKKDEMINDFLTLLKSHCDIENKIEGMIYNFQKNVKTAEYESQYTSQFDNGMGSWWFLGIIEKMLTPSRGSDWSTYQSLEPMHKELFDTIEKARRKKGRDGLTFEALLRVKDGENDPKNCNIIEKALSSDRIW